jgi:hypothetical protein
MTGRNPWVVLCVAEDAPGPEVQRAFRRRLRQTHPDRGGGGGEFATVVQAFADARHTLPPKRHPSPFRPTPYDGWLTPHRPTRSWTEDGPTLSLVEPACGDSAATTPWPRGDVSAVLRREMAKAGSVATLQ